jgi:peptidoglycan biosynthesis protein MviN/MurJ (putative lipid II flippase)
MVNFGLKKLLARILAAAGLLNIVLALLLVLHLKHVGIAIASLTTEIFVTAVMFAALRRKGLNVFGRSDRAVDNRQTAA